MVSSGESNGTNPFIIISAIILGIGHIGIHLGHKKEVEEEAGIKNMG